MTDNKAFLVSGCDPTTTLTFTFGTQDPSLVAHAPAITISRLEAGECSAYRGKSVDFHTETAPIKSPLPRVVRMWTRKVTTAEFLPEKTVRRRVSLEERCCQPTNPRLRGMQAWQLYATSRQRRRHLTRNRSPAALRNCVRSSSPVFAQPVSMHTLSSASVLVCISCATESSLRQ